MNTRDLDDIRAAFYGGSGVAATGAGRDFLRGEAVDMVGRLLGMVEQLSAEVDRLRALTTPSVDVLDGEESALERLLDVAREFDADASEGVPAWEWTPEEIEGAVRRLVDAAQDAQTEYHAVVDGVNGP